MIFKGKSRVHAKREALAFWSRNRERLGMTLKEFLARCRMTEDERSVVFDRTARAG